jgi:ABC-type sugar transport system permease subunit
MTAISPSASRSWRRPTRSSSLARREARWGLLFLSPWIVGFVAFTLLPMAATLAFTFTNVTLTQEEPLRFVGLRNYEALIGDSQVWESLLITLRFALIALPVGMVVPFAVALLLNSRHLMAPGLFRVLFFMPYVVPLVAGVLAWQGMLNPASGWINQFLRTLGVANPPEWLNDPGWVYPALVIVGLWGIGSAIVVNLAGLKGIPSELYDAAKVDGAGWFASLRHVTLPLMSPVLFYLLLLEIVALFQYFLVPLVLNNGTGDPGGMTLFYNLYLYKTFFTFHNMSYGATLAWLLFAITMVVALLLFRASRRFVFYAGERT